jgi:hypothetical protein
VQGLGHIGQVEAPSRGFAHGSQLLEIHGEDANRRTATGGSSFSALSKPPRRRPSTENALASAWKT